MSARMVNRPLFPLIRVLAAMLLAVPALAADRPPVVVFAEADAAASTAELAAEPSSYEQPASADGATLEASATCSPSRLRGIDVELSWQVELAQKEGYRVDVSMFGDGFQKGRYLTSGELSAASGGLLFEEALPGIYYYWRVLTRTPDGWVVSGNGRFDAPICPVDEVRE